MTGSALAACVTAFTFLPFLPGPYDRLAEPLSGTAWFLGKAAMLLVPVGALWLAAGNRLSSRPRLLPAVALTAAALVWALGSLGALATGGPSMGTAAVAAGIYVIARLAARLRAPGRIAPGSARGIAISLVAAPVVVLTLQTALAGPATEFSRNRAMDSAGRMIADIEQYRTSRGEYPTSLASLHNDYRPRLLGIREFRYERSGAAYNLYFHHPTLMLGTEEVVMYNPRDEQVMTSHDMDRLQFTGADLERRRGYYSVHDAARPHWKYFWFD